MKCQVDRSCKVVHRRYVNGLRGNVAGCQHERVHSIVMRDIEVRPWDSSGAGAVGQAGQIRNLILNHQGEEVGSIIAETAYGKALTLPGCLGGWLTANRRGIRPLGPIIYCRTGPANVIQ